MATSKAIKKDREVKSPGGARTRKVVKEVTENQKPNEEHIRVKAQEIYYQRIERGEDGTALNDWFEAIAVLSDLN